tara:strand:+ start:56 stop:772 length:717 start_codon:yes stop_codon:yes gene_type:complete
MNLTVIIPAYKETDNIEILIDKINKNLKDPYIILIDDSPDNSIEKIIKKFNNLKYIFRGKKLGRGSAVLDGMKQVINDREIQTVIEMDADLSHDPNELSEKLNFFRTNNCDLLISSRYLNDSRIINWSIQRKIFSFLSNKLTRFLLKVPITDYTNGYRIYSKEAVRHITRKCGKIGDGFIILSEILVELYYNNFKILETSTIFRNRVRGESSVNLKEIIDSFFGLIKIFKLKKKLENS